MKYKVIIVDDHPIFRDGFKSFLQTRPNVGDIYEAENGAKFIEFIKENEIDLAFMDINMPEKDGFLATQEAMDITPDLKIIGISSFDNIDYIDKMLESGAQGYILKDAGYQEIEEAINRVMSGGNYFSAKVLTKLTQRVMVKKQEDKVKADLPNFTERELEVLQLLCNGMSRSEIAEQLFISERTVDKHRENLQLKTATKNTVSLVLFGLRHKLIDMEL